MQVKIWRDFCIDRCKEFINFFPLFFDETKTLSKKKIVKKYYLKGDSHFNMVGNKKIFDKLKKINFIKD